MKFISSHEKKEADSDVENKLVDTSGEREKGGNIEIGG